MSVSILVVDDEPDVAELFRQTFRRETRQGTYVLHYATSGAEALHRLAGGIEPTLVAVLSDINMPGMDGLQLLGEIKRRLPDLLVMMVTAYGDDERRRQASEKGAAEFFTKPIDFDHHSSGNCRAETGPLDRMTACSIPPIDPRVGPKVGSGARRAVPAGKAERPLSLG